MSGVWVKPESADELAMMAIMRARAKNRPEITDEILAALAERLLARADSSEANEKDEWHAGLLRSTWEHLRAQHAAWLLGDEDVNASEVDDQATGERYWCGKHGQRLDLDAVGLPADIVTALGTGQFVEHGRYGMSRKLVNLVLIGHC
jgi:hypothetical protein